LEDGSLKLALGAANLLIRRDHRGVSVTCQGKYSLGIRRLNNTTTAPDLVSRLRAGLSGAELVLLEACEAAARTRAQRLYLVGGPVRDLLLGLPALDLDLALEGDVKAIAEEAASRTRARLILHPRFGTAKLSLADVRVDLARTRRETYAHPGALPAVEPASLAEDLARRDFSINAMALCLVPEAGVLIDPYRGEADLRNGLVRVLHAQSFQDDPTRMLRACRYAARFGFKVQRETESLLRRDLQFLKAVSGPRLRRELALLFEEDRAVDGLELAARFGVLGATHPSLRLRPETAGRLREALAGPRQASREETCFCVLADPRDEAAAASVSRWLHLHGRVERALRDLVRLREASSKLAAAAPVDAVELLDGLAPSAVWAFSILEAGPAADACRAYLTRWRHVRPHLSGNDLLALGLEQGVAIGEMLARLRQTRLQMPDLTRDQEIDLVRAAMSAERR